MNPLYHKPLVQQTVPSLSRAEIITLFLSTLSDVYNLKSHFLSYLPAMADKATYPRLKRAILETAFDVEAHKLRINIIFKILRYEPDDRPEPLKGQINIESYISYNMDSLACYKTDFVLFTHLLMVENMEITHYKILKMLCMHIQHKEIYSLIVQSLQDAVRKKQSYEIIGRMYRSENFPG